MIGQKTIGMTEPMVTIAYLLQHIKRHPSSLGVFEKRVLSIPSGGTMINNPRIIYPQWSRLTNLLLHPISNVNIQDLIII
jgi:hypothetical protein